MRVNGPFRPSERVSDAEAGVVFTSHGNLLLNASSNERFISQRDKIAFRLKLPTKESHASGNHMKSPPGPSLHEA